MKLPTWLSLTFLPNGKIRIRFRKWHPGLWLDVYRELRSTTDATILEALWYTGVFVWHA